MSRMTASFERLSPETVSANSKVIESEKRIEEATKSLASQIQRSFHEAQQRATSSLSNISTGINRITGVFATMTTALAGGKAFESVIMASQKWTGEVTSISKALGISTEQASIYNAALRLIGKSQDELVGIVFKFMVQLKSNEARLNAVGVATRNARGELLHMDQLLQNALRTVSSYKQGTDRNAAAMYLFGGSAQEVTGFLKLTDQKMAEARETATRLNLVVGKDGVEASLKYKEEMAQLNLTLESTKIKTGDEVLSKFIKLGEWLGEVGPVAAKAFTITLGYVAAGLDIVGTGVERFGVRLGAAVASGQTAAQGLWPKAKAVFTGNWKELRSLNETESADQKTIFASANQDLDDILNVHVERVVRMFEKVPKVPKFDPNTGTSSSGSEGRSWSGTPTSLFEKAQEDLQDAQMKRSLSDQDAMTLQEEEAFWTQYCARIKAGAGEASEDYQRGLQKLAKIKRQIHDQRTTGGGGAASGGSDRDFRAELDEELAEERAAGVDTKRYELARWNDRIAALKEGSREYKEALREVNRLNREIADEERKSAEERQKEEAKDQEAKAEAKAAHEGAGIGLQEEEVRTRKELGQISAQEELTQLQQLEDRKYEIEQAAVWKRIELLQTAGELTKAEETKLYGQIEAIQDKQALSQLQTLNKIKVDQANTWKTIATQISSTMTNAITGMLSKTQSLANGLKSIWNSIAAHIIGKIVETTVQFIAEELRKTIFAWTQEGSRTAAATAGVVARDGIQDAGNASGLAKQAATGMKAVFNDAKLAASGAYQSASQIPYVGWLLGPIAAAAAFAAVMAFGTLTSAAGGWGEVPEDQLAMVHKSEMVLPAHLARQIREISDPSATISRAVNLAVSSAFGPSPGLWTPSPTVRGDGVRASGPAATSPSADSVSSAASALPLAGSLASAVNVLRNGLASAMLPAVTAMANGPSKALAGIGSYGIPADKLQFTRSILSGGGLSFGTAGSGAGSAPRRGASGDVTVNNPTFQFPSNLADLVKSNPNALYRGIRDGVKRGQISKRNFRR